MVSPALKFKRPACLGGLYAVAIHMERIQFMWWRRSGPRVWGARPRVAARYQTPRLPLGRRGRLGHDVCKCARPVVWPQGTCGCPVTTRRTCRRRRARDGPGHGRQSTASHVGAPLCGSPLRSHHLTITCMYVYACICAPWGGGASINGRAKMVLSPAGWRSDASGNRVPFRRRMSVLR